MYSSRYPATLPPKITGSMPLLEENLLRSMSNSTPTKGAAKKPTINRTRWTIFLELKSFFEIRKPMKTPHRIKLIVETHLITISNSPPGTLSSLRPCNNRKTIKAITDNHSDLVKFIFSSKKHYPAALFKA